MNRSDFEKFVTEQQGPLRRFLLNLSRGNQELSDDIAQEAFMKAYVSLPSFGGRSKMSTWLFKIAYYCYLDYLKSTAHKFNVLTTDQEGVMTFLTADASYESDVNYRNQQLYMALDRVGESERVPLLLFYMESKSIKEIAQIMNVESSVVKMRLSRGRAHLKEYLLTLGYER